MFQLVNYIVLSWITACIFFSYNRDHFSYVFNLLNLFFTLYTYIFLVAEYFIFNNSFGQVFLRVRDVTGLLSNDLLRYIFMLYTDQCFFIFWKHLEMLYWKKSYRNSVFILFVLSCVKGVTSFENISFLYLSHSLCNPLYSLYWIINFFKGFWKWCLRIGWKFLFGCSTTRFCVG